MKLSLLTIAAGLAHLVASQVENLPQCARSCVTQFTTGGSIGDCQSLDAACICSSAGFLSGIACCLAGTCNEADQASAVTFAQTFCKAAGVTNLPSAVTCASTASSTASSTANSNPSSTADSNSSPTTDSNPSPTTDSNPAPATNSPPSATEKSGAQRLEYIGAGVLGSLAAGIMLL